MTKKRILIVDDDVTAARMLKLSLERTGAYEVRDVHRGTEALPAAQQFRPDLVLLDVCMPDADGGDVAFLLSSDANLRATPIVFLTSLVSEHETEETSNLIGGYPFLAKPARVAVVVACIEKHLAPVRSDREATTNQPTGKP